jgi:chaperonin GroES
MENEFELEALFDSVIVKIIEREETLYGSIVVPDAGKEKNETGVVVAVGPGAHTVTGEFVASSLKVGEEVILPSMGFTKLEFDGIEYLIGCEKSVLAKVRKTN